MGVIRGGLFSLVCVLMFLSFLSGGVLLVLSLSLDYDILESEMVPALRELVGEEIGFEQSMPLMEAACQNNTEYHFYESTFNKTIIFPCDVIYSGSGAVVDYGIKEFLKKIYYSDYDCGFWKCLTGEYPFVLISQKAKDYWFGKYYSLLIFSIILIVAGFLLVKNKMNYPIILGAVLAGSALPLLKLRSFLTLLIPESFEDFFTVLISQTQTVFNRIFLVGLVILILGVVLRIVFAKFVKQEFSKSEVKDIVKKEVAKSKKEVKKPVKKKVVKKAKK